MFADPSPSTILVILILYIVAKFGDRITRFKASFFPPALEFTLQPGQGALQGATKFAKCEP